MMTEALTKRDREEGVLAGACTAPMPDAGTLELGRTTIVSS